MTTLLLGFGKHAAGLTMTLVGLVSVALVFGANLIRNLTDRFEPRREAAFLWATTFAVVALAALGVWSQMR